MTSQTLRAIRAILEADSTVSEERRKHIIGVCNNPDGEARPASPVPGKALTVRDVTGMLQVSKRMVWRLAREGKLQRIKLGRRSTRFSSPSVERLMGLRE